MHIYYCQVSKEHGDWATSCCLKPGHGGLCSTHNHPEAPGSTPIPGPTLGALGVQESLGIEHQTLTVGCGGIGCSLHRICGDVGDNDDHRLRGSGPGTMHFRGDVPHSIVQSTPCRWKTDHAKLVPTAGMSGSPSHGRSLGGQKETIQRKGYTRGDAEEQQGLRAFPERKLAQ